MNLRIKRLESDFEKEISILLQTEIKDPLLKNIVITGCHITNDLSFAKVYYTILGDETIEERTKIDISLKKASSFIRGQLSNKIDMRYTPEINFIYDNSIEYGIKIEKKLQDLHEKEQNEKFY